MFTYLIAILPLSRSGPTVAAVLHKTECSSHIFEPTVLSYTDNGLSVHLFCRAAVCRERERQRDRETETDRDKQTRDRDREEWKRSPSFFNKAWEGGWGGGGGIVFNRQRQRGTHRETERETERSFSNEQVKKSRKNCYVTLCTVTVYCIYIYWLHLA